MSPPNHTAANATDQPCPCGSGLTFDSCCQPILLRAKVAATAEQLMRSRFTAHALHDFEHLHRTYLPTAHQPYVAEPEEAPRMNWTRLVIHAHEPGAKPDTAFVDFTAYHRDEAGEHAHHEKSEFLRVGGEWYFARPVREGPAPLKSAHPKVGRNDPCLCGSGKKFKHCCGK